MDRRRRFSAFVPCGRDPHSTILKSLRFAREFLPNSNVDEHVQVRTMIVVEELVSNVLRHGIGKKDRSFWLSLGKTESGILVEIEDDGEPFDPASSSTFANTFDGPDPKTGGGIGLAIVRAWGEDMTYSRSGNRNVLRLTIKSLG